MNGSVNGSKSQLLDDTNEHGDDLIPDASDLSLLLSTSVPLDPIAILVGARAVAKPGSAQHGHQERIKRTGEFRSSASVERVFPVGHIRRDG